MQAYLTLGAYLALFALMTAAALVDIRKRIIPNKVILAIIVTWAVWRLAIILASPCWMDVVIESAALLLASSILGIVLLAFTVIAENLTGKNLFGGGDIKLLLAISLFMGIEPTLAAMLVASLLSLVYAASRSVRMRAQGIPYAPCMLCGALLVLIAV